MKKAYIQPSIKAHNVKPAQIICGSGGTSATIPGGNGGGQPTPSGGIIKGDSKGASYDFEDDDF